MQSGLEQEDVWMAPAPQKIAFVSFEYLRTKTLPQMQKDLSISNLQLPFEAHQRLWR